VAPSSGTQEFLNLPIICSGSLSATRSQNSS
jgi:hypothetical protein